MIILLIGLMIVTYKVLDYLKPDKIYSIVLIIIYILVVYYLSYIGSILIHELGHILFGVLVGRKFVSLRLLNINFEYKDRFKVSKVKNQYDSKNQFDTLGENLTIAPEFKLSLIHI